MNFEWHVALHDSHTPIANIPRPRTTRRQPRTTTMQRWPRTIATRQRCKTTRRWRQTTKRMMTTCLRRRMTTARRRRRTLMTCEVVESLFTYFFSNVYDRILYCILFTVLFPCMSCIYKCYLHLCTNGVQSPKSSKKGWAHPANFGQIWQRETI